MLVNDERLLGTDDWGCVWVTTKDVESEELPPHMVCVTPSEIKLV